MPNPILVMSNEIIRAMNGRWGTYSSKALLGEASALFKAGQTVHDRKLARYEIIENLEEETVSFFCACYSKICTVDEVHGKYHRQDIYKKLWEAAVSEGTQGDPFPIGMSHQVNLVHDANNRYDVNATMLIFRNRNKEDKKLEELDGFHLGYVPQVISERINKEKRRINIVRVLEIVPQIHGSEYFNVKLLLQYDGNGPQGKNLKRFESLVE